MTNIPTALNDFAQDEGIHAATYKAEQWRDVLEEMLEVGDHHQRWLILQLLMPIRVFLGAPDEKHE